MTDHRRQIAQLELDRLIFRAIRFQIVQSEAGEIGDQKVSRNFLVAAVVFEVLHIADCLRVRLAQVFAARFVLGDELALPEQVDEFGVSFQVPDRLLEAGDGAPSDAEDVEKFIPESLRLGAFPGSVRPGAGEGDRALPNFSPRKGHGRGC